MLSRQPPQLVEHFEAARDTSLRRVCRRRYLGPRNYSARKRTRPSRKASAVGRTYVVATRYPSSSKVTGMGSVISNASMPLGSVLRNPMITQLPSRC